MFLPDAIYYEPDSENYEFGVYIADTDNYIGDFIEWGSISEHLYKADVLINGRLTIMIKK